MTAEAQTEVQSKAQATPEAGVQVQHVSFAGALLGFMITTTLTTSIMVLLSQG
ncbi:MAG TPA: hypothetical protein VH743_21390 [Beijerinckiaceae bacterium]